MYLKMVADLELIVSPGISLLLTRVSRFLAEKGIKSYLVGGFVRDLLLQRETADIDIAITTNALHVAARIAPVLGGKYVPLDAINGIARVVLPPESAPTGSKLELDFSTVTDTIEQDLVQRDFAIDAMAIELSGEALFHLTQLIDPHHGYDDLQHKVIRTVSNTAFRADPARLLRAARLAAELGFNIDPATEALIRQHHHLIRQVAGERIREELLHLLALPQAGHFLSYLDELNVLTSIIPELESARDVSQPWIHFWDVLEHSVKTVSAVDFLLHQGGWQFGGNEVLAVVPWSPGLSQHFAQKVSIGSTRGALLKLAALLHDIAKPQTKTIDNDGRARFLGHARTGADVAAGILERLRFSSREIKLVELMVRHHLHPSQMSQDELPTPRAVYRYFRDVGEAAMATLFLNLADHLATRGPLLDKNQWEQHCRMTTCMLEWYFQKEKQVLPAKLIDGHDLINIFSLKPGPEIGKLLEAVREAQAAGEVTTQNEALEYIKHLLAHPEETTQNISPRGNHD